jgi:hypothetical protein
MKFIVERIALVGMIQLLSGKSAGQKRSDRMMRLSACAGRVFVESNQVVAGVEALVLQEGSCRLPRVKFLKIIETFAPKENLTIEVAANRLHIANFSMGAIAYTPEAIAPADFKIFPVTDAWLARKPIGEPTRTEIATQHKNFPRPIQ